MEQILGSSTQTALWRSQKPSLEDESALQLEVQTKNLADELQVEVTEDRV